MSNDAQLNAAKLFAQSVRPSALQILASRLPPAPPAPPSPYEQIVPPELRHEMRLIDAYAADVEEYGHTSEHTLESLKELVDHLLTLKNKGDAA